MKAILLKEPGKFELVQISEPAGPGPGEALVRVHRVGICGTDISGYLGKMPFYSYPRIPGHELGVEVIAAGPGVSNVKPGDRCSVEPYLNCQHCYACRRGNGNCCESLQVLGVHTDGGLRPQFLVPARKLHRSGKLTLDQLALVETLGIGCHAVSRGRPEAGDNVLVIGAGPIGLSVIEFLRIAGAVITVMDVNQMRLDFCKQTLRVPHPLCFQGDDSELARVREITSGALFAVVFDATGNTEVMRTALEACHRGWGTSIIIGVAEAGREISTRPFQLVTGRNWRGTAFGGARGRTDTPKIVDWYMNGKIEIDPMITHVMPLAEINNAFELMKRGESIRGVVTF